MSLAQQQHTQAALADTAADGQGQFVVQQHLVEKQLAAVIAAGQRQLTIQSLTIHADAHGADLKRAVQHGVIEKNIAVHGPVVIVGGAAVVGLAVGQLAADAHQEGDGVLPHEKILPLLGTLVGIKIQKLLGGNEGDFPAQLGMQLGIAAVDDQRSVADAAHDLPHRILQGVQIAGLRGDDPLPVPLVDVDGVQVVQFFVPADGVHVGINALARMEVVAVQRHALPFRQRLHHLRVHACGGDIKADGTLHAVQVVVQAGGGLHEQRRRHPLQVQRLRQMVLKSPLDQADSGLRFIKAQFRLITGRDKGFAHSSRPFAIKDFLLPIIAFFREIVMYSFCL